MQRENKYLHKHISKLLYSLAKTYFSFHTIKQKPKDKLKYKLRFIKKNTSIRAFFLLRLRGMQLGKENFRFVNKLNLNMNPSKGVQHNAGTWSVQVFLDYLSESSVLIRQFGKTLWSLVKTDMALLYRILVISPCTLSQVLLPKFIRCNNYFNKFLNSCKDNGTVFNASFGEHCPKTESWTNIDCLGYGFLNIDLVLDIRVHVIKCRRLLTLQIWFALDDASYTLFIWTLW